MLYKITFSQELPDDATCEQIREWAESQLGARAGIRLDNPLIDIELSAERVWFDV